MENTNQKTKPALSENLQVGPTEILYLSGLLLLFLGLALWLGVGVAFTACGGVLIGTALLNGIQQGSGHVI